MSNGYDASVAPGDNIVVVMADGDAPDFDIETNTTQIPLDDGTVEISMGPPKVKKPSTEFDANLAESLTDAELSAVAEKLLRGIDLDLQSRSEWLENMSAGISLLGLQIKVPRGAAASGATPQEGISTVDHPLLLEAVLRFQANARGELLPADGPVKVRNDGEGNQLAEKLADALEKDLNHYLTKVAKEYYPDTDRMLLLLGFSGISFKKGYHCPIKRRPVIVSIDSNDLIVSNAATDIDGAGRVTHRINMRPSVLRRMQLLGAYLDVTLAPTGMMPTPDAVDTKINQTQGIAPATSIEAEDQDRELYECYCEIELAGFEHTLKDGDEDKPTGLPLPYKVTIDKESRRVLEIRRNWEEEDEFCMARNRIVAYIFIPGFGFYGIGLLNVLGNATKAVTAAWRLMLDAGMFANFPGFLYLKSLGKQLTNQFRVPPGGGMPIDVVGNDIKSAIMPLPYRDASPAMMQLIDGIVSTAQRVGGTAELQIGEGRQDAPVGTTLALIEQATKMMSAVHKRLHQAQGTEFSMLKSLLKEDPAALWRHNKKSCVLKCLLQLAGQQAVTDATEAAEERHREMFLAALDDCELIPRADPNTASHTERIMKAVALVQMAMQNPSMDRNAVAVRVLQTIGIDDYQTLFVPPSPPGSEAPPPEAVMAQATATAAQARMLTAQTDQMTAQIKARQAAQQAGQAATDSQADIATKQEELAAKERIARLQVGRELVIHASDQQHAAEQAERDRQNALRTAGIANQGRAADRMHGLALANLRNRHAAGQGAAQRAHQATEGARDRLHDLLTQPPPEPSPQGIAPRP